jgi:amino acid transporter
MSTAGSAPTVPAPGTESAKLHRRALGVPDLVFFIVAASAPLTVVAGGQAATYLVTGNRAVPFMYIPLGIVLVLFTVGYAAMSRYIANAGAFYSYIAHGLGRVAGVGAAFVALIAYNGMQVGIQGLFGVALGAFMAGALGIVLPWWAWCFIFTAIIAILGVLQIDLNARVLAVALTLEVLVLVVYDLAVVASPGPQGFTLVGFDPTIAFGTAAGATLTFCVASFVGFESAAIYSEECRDPRRTVARATFLAIGLIAVFYALSGWLLGVAAGPDTIVNPQALVEGGYATAGNPDPTTVLFITGQERLGALWGTSAGLLFATSLFAALLSFHNAVARYTFALGREGVLPSVFSRVQPRTGAPWIASLAQSIFAFSVVGIFALAGADPVLQLFTWLTNLGALGVLLLMAVTSFAVVGYFRRRPEPGVGRWASTIAPAIAGILLLTILLLGVANFNVLITGLIDAPVNPMTVVLPAILFGGGIVGLIVGMVLRSRRPDVYERIGSGPGSEEAEDGLTAQHSGT